LKNEILNIKLGQLLSSLSLALDIAENRYFGHSRRTAYIAYTIAKEMNFSEEEIVNTYYASLIHDIGMAGQMSRYSVIEIHFDDVLKKDHCSLGGKVVSKLPLSSDIIDYILYHHEEWDGSGVYGLSGDDIPLPAQIIHLADFFELFFLRRHEEMEQKIELELVKEWINTYKNKMFNEEICVAFLSIIEKDKFWFDLKFENIREALNIIEPDKNTTVDIYDLKRISQAFSILIDSKSPFTYEHSQGIAKITNKFSTYLGYNPLMVEKLEIAANLHDIGKLNVPNSILEKPGKLSEEEFQIIKAHPYYTKLILKQVEGIEDIAEWAGNHHEKLNGKGYPEKLDYRSITKEDQVIVLADIYQALTEDRPYRKGMKPKSAIDIMMGMAKKNYIDYNLLLEFKQIVV
jgi:HD-GYP domain-containing protein (c-di-GMP phosphodiesterase class II)